MCTSSRCGWVLVLGFYRMLVRRVREALLLPASQFWVTNGVPRLAALVTLFCAILTSQTSAKTPGTVHCYGGWCHRVSTIDEMHSMVGQRGYLRASYYDDCRVDRFNACGLTSSGEVFRPDRADNAASPIFPDGTVLLAYNPANGSAAVLRVNSTGPYRGDRRLDVSRATAEKLGFQKKGVADLAVTVLKSPEPEDARYKKLRTYARVPGYIGNFKNFDAAHDAAINGLNMQLELTMAALDSGLDPELMPPDPRAALKDLPRVEVAAVPARERVFASPPEWDARTSEIVHVKLTDRPETVPEAQIITLAQGPLPAGVPERPGSNVIAAMEQSVPARMVGQEDQRNSQDVDVETSPVTPTTVAKSASAMARLAAFIEAARAEARIKSGWSIARNDRLESTWGEQIHAFIHDARVKARASVVRDGVMQRFTAELTLKARRYR